MKAVQLIESTGPSGLRVAELPDLDPADDLVVVDLHAAGVSFPDLLQTTGSYQIVQDLPCVLGVEGAGVVRSAPRHSGLAEGQRVAVLALAGAWQQTVAVPVGYAFPLPNNVSLTAASGFVMNHLTVHLALVERARCKKGESVLVHGAAGGIGTAALHLAAALGLETIAVVSSEDKAAVAKANGATHTVLVDGFKDRVLELTGGRGVDIVLDPVGGDRFTDSLRSLATNGRALVLGFTGGEIPTVKVNRLLLKNISVVGVGWGEYIRADPSYLVKQWDDLLPLLNCGALTVPEPTLYEAAHAADALLSLSERTATGKVSLTLH
ncbi:NADPH:quinone oxidoreductase family protein [Rhodococcus wratislaviensis]|uniref:NADPH:quinone oxidoreductase family protein n=1 Tax=Rhodococcus wratislaviensis TaxID=44752 RepID=UPI003516D50A